MRDKCKNIPDEFEILKCRHCNTNHTQFDCPKLHFIPITQHLVNKHLHQCRVGRCRRRLFERSRLTHRTLKSYLQVDRLLAQERMCHTSEKMPTVRQFILDEFGKVNKYSLRERTINEADPIELGKGYHDIKEAITSLGENFD